MTHPSLGPGDHAPDIINAIVEIPTGSRVKYEFDHATGMIFVDRVLFSPFHYPAEYGFIPRTLAPDGDPCDVLVLINGTTYPGVIIRARPVGLPRACFRVRRGRAGSAGRAGQGSRPRHIDHTPREGNAAPRSPPPQPGGTGPAARIAASRALCV